MDPGRSMCREQAAYCAQLLNKPLDPQRRAQLERERQDWLVLADQQETWLSVQAEERQREMRG